MQSTKRISVPGHLTMLVILAQLLEHLERNPGGIHPDQYRSVVRHLTSELVEVSRDDTFESLLEAFPAMSQLYENLHYKEAGLCRSPLDTSVAAELSAGAALERASKAAGQ